MKDDDDNGGRPSLEDLFKVLALSMPCSHEKKLNRVMGVLGALALKHGGSLVVDLQDLEHLDGQSVSIEIDKAMGTATVVVEPSSSEPVEPTHSAPSSIQ